MSAELPHFTSDLVRAEQEDVDPILYATQRAIGSSAASDWPEEARAVLEQHVHTTLMHVGQIVQFNWNRISTYTDQGEVVFTNKGMELHSTNALPIKEACPQLRGPQISRGFKHNVNTSLAYLQSGAKNWEEFEGLRYRQSQFKGSVNGSRGRSSVRTHSDPQINPR